MSNWLVRNTPLNLVHGVIGTMFEPFLHKNLCLTVINQINRMVRDGRYLCLRIVIIQPLVVHCIMIVITAIIMTVAPFILLLSIS